MFELTSKTVFITGGGGGIGGGMAQAFAERGARIVLADIDAGFAQEEAAKLPPETKVQVVALDVRSLDSWKAAKALVESHFGAIDVLCNNAGISIGFKPLVEVSPEEFERVMAVNVTGVYNGIKTFVPAMIERGSGHVVNTSSLNGLAPFSSLAGYSASKFAVLGLSDSLREELVSAGVGVSTLFPGLTRSRMSESSVAGRAAHDPERIAAIRANMMDPVWLGRAVVRAVEHNEPYIITHPEYRDNLAERHEHILAAFGEPAQPGYKTGSSATG
jgi:NAD(P)-dependent dehydrogenase (short-subunit alcohol dehydrogenase family)